MPENNQTNTDTNTTKKRNRNPFKTAQSLFQRLPIGLRYIMGGAAFCFLLIVAIAIIHPSLNERWKFGTDMTLNLLILFAIAVQAYIYREQWNIMDNSLEENRKEIARITKPRLRITNVRVKNLLEDQRPVFIVSIKNDGATDAEKAILEIEVSIGFATNAIVCRWPSPQIVTISAGQEQHYHVPWMGSLGRFEVNAMNETNTEAPIRVKGWFEIDTQHIEFCYQYYPWKGKRPKKLAQFFPCDFDTRLAVFERRNHVEMVAIEPRPLDAGRFEIKKVTDSKGKEVNPN